MAVSPLGAVKEERMPLSKSDLLNGSDLTTKEVALPALKGTVTVQALPAAYSNQAQSDALEVVTGRRGEQTARVNTAKLEEIQVLHGLVDPRFDSIEEVRAFSMKYGSSWRLIVNAIDEISGIDKEEIEKANAMFQDGGSGAERRDDVANGASRREGARRPDVPVRAGA
jgi:predicted RecB family endonuclease